MTATLMLRLASVISMLFAAGHTLGGQQSWSPIGESEVLTAMRTFRFETMGVSRTYLDFYRGFGFTLSVFMVMQAILLWQVGTLAKTDRIHARPLIVTFLLASIATGVLAWKFIFPLPVYLGATVTACLGLALVAGR
ncbi:MAG TPA: hypothetical protein VNZ26_27190 [Vicinamibacterales bacterium]|jgi:hypothetical protein|nr:hypothetical protein [Vicinamibacterales bacterium]